MASSMKASLKPLLESRHGVHLSAYIVNSGDALSIKKQVRSIVEESKEWLSPVLSPEEQVKFMEPISGLLKDMRFLCQFKRNIGLFRSHKIFRILSVPVDVEPTVQFASSFHVKPLLQWIQSDNEFLILGVEDHSAHLYLASQDSCRLIDTVLFQKSDNKSVGDYSELKELRNQKLKQEHAFSWINSWISEVTRGSSPHLFLCGDRFQVERLKNKLSYRNITDLSEDHPFSKSELTVLCLKIRRRLKDQAQKKIERSLLEFKFADEANRTNRNIFQISKAAAEGKISKLIVTSDFCIFGKVDILTGKLSLHPIDLDHEDDDVLDDLAQLVLRHGGEVIVAKASQIPKGRPILALVNSEEEGQNSVASLNQYDVLQERYG